MRFDRDAFAAQVSPLWLWHVPVLLVLFVLDRDLSDASRLLADRRTLLFFTEVVTPLGKGYYQLPALLACLLVTALIRGRSAQAAQQSLGAFVLSALAANLLKFTLQRPRPICPPGLAPGWLDAFGDPNWLSYPSADTATTFALACVLSRYLPVGRPGYWTLATLVALGRVVRQAHYPSDAYVGALVGVLAGKVALCLYFGRRPRVSCQRRSGATTEGTADAPG